MPCNFFKPPKIDSNQHDTTTTTFNSPCRNHFKVCCVRESTSKFSRFQTKSSHIIAYEFHQCGVLNYKQKIHFFCLQDSSHWLIIGIKGFDQQCTDTVSSPQIYYSSRHNASISKFVALQKSPYLTYRARSRNSIRSKNIRAKQGNIVWKLSVDNGMQFTGRKLFLTDRHKLHGP